jgi:hypothetical protein
MKYCGFAFACGLNYFIVGSLLFAIVSMRIEAAPENRNERERKVFKLKNSRLRRAKESFAISKMSK